MCHHGGMAEYDFPTAEFVKDPEAGEVLAVEHTREYSRAVLAFNAATCGHAETAPYRVRIANGAVQVRDCCNACGERVGTARSQKDKAWVESLPWQSDELAASYTTRRHLEREAMLLALAKKQYAERGRLTKGYADYLASDAWKAKRGLVLKRCGGTCEGCGVAPATEVHHRHYDHLFNEFLFELLGLCHACHERITLERLGDSDDAPDDIEIVAADAG